MAAARIERGTQAGTHGKRHSRAASINREPQAQKAPSATAKVFAPVSTESPSRHLAGLLADYAKADL
jgi:hypothetical protein